MLDIGHLEDGTCIAFSAGEVEATSSVVSLGGVSSISLAWQNEDAIDKLKRIIECFDIVDEESKSFWELLRGEIGDLREFEILWGK